ncbi:pyridoxal phosphate-dependent transferase, partial [Mycena vulgaris]
FRGLFPRESIPGMISLLAGRLNPSTFPFESISMKLRSTLAGMPAPTREDDPFNLTLEGDVLNEALQYGGTAGVTRFIDVCCILGIQTDVSVGENTVARRIPDACAQAGTCGTWAISVGSGSQDLMYKASCEALVVEGDSVLVETPFYPRTLGFLAALPCSLIEVNADSQGLNPANLDSILANWETTYPGKRFPKLLCTIPSGSDPTGASIPEARKVEVLKLAKKYNFLVLEDDTYAFLYYGPEGKQARSSFALEPEVNSEMGRVVRFDSFSKVLSNGMRLGYMTAPPRLGAAVNMITSNTNLQPATLTQVMAYTLLSRWGPNGFLEHCGGVAGVE